MYTVDIVDNVAVVDVADICGDADPRSTVLCERCAGVPECMCIL